jgi:hypothetical protein
VTGPIDIILLSYNRLDYLIEMVDALEQRTRLPYRLTIVDNASGPQTRQWLREHRTRFEHLVFNPVNEHLAGHARGIAATSSELFVLSDADLVPHEPEGERCWLTALVELAERHPDFALIGTRLDSVSEARNARLESAPLVDGEILETPTGVWLNLMRRSALRVPFMSDGITCYALRRAGYRVGIAASVHATHLGDLDPERHPDYLARKVAASGWGVTYPDYPELSRAARPPSLIQLALAAPVLAAADMVGIGAEEIVELAGAEGATASAAEPLVRLAAAVPPGAARAVAVIDPTPQVLAAAFAGAQEWVLVSAGTRPPAEPAGWRLALELPAVTPALERFARAAGRRWNTIVARSTVEHRESWLAVFRAACFGEEMPRRVYALRRDEPLAPEGEISAALDPRRGPRAPRRRVLGPLATKAFRLLRAEWHLRRWRAP